MTDRYIIADASKVSGRDFFDAVTGSSPEKRAERDRLMRERCIRLIEVGASLYGYPPDLVDECRAIIAEREQLTECHGDPFLDSMKRTVRV